MKTFVNVLGAIALIALSAVGWFTLVANDQVLLAVLGASAVLAALALNSEKKGK